jgi:hypothetical protein
MIACLCQARDLELGGDADMWSATVLGAIDVRRAMSAFRARSDQVEHLALPAGQIGVVRRAVPAGQRQGAVRVGLVRRPDDSTPTFSPAGGTGVRV